jgi:hypothetical protein
MLVIIIERFLFLISFLIILIYERGLKEEKSERIKSISHKLLLETFRSRE